MGFCCSRSDDSFTPHAVCLKESADSLRLSQYSRSLQGSPLLQFEVETLLGEHKRVKSPNSPTHLYEATELAFKGKYRRFTLFCSGWEVTEAWRADARVQPLVLTLVPAPSYVTVHA